MNFLKVTDLYGDVELINPARILRVFTGDHGKATIELAGYPPQSSAALLHIKQTFDEIAFALERGR